MSEACFYCHAVHLAGPCPSMNYAECAKCGVVMPCRAHPIDSSAVTSPPQDETPHDKLLKAAVSDRDAHPWRYYKLDHETMKKLLEEMVVKSQDAALAHMKAQDQILSILVARVNAIDDGAAVLSAWVRRPWWERLRARVGL